MNTDTMKAVFRQSPELVFAALGLAFYFVPSENYRLTTLTGIFPVGLALVLRHALAAILTIMLCVWYMKKSNLRLGRKKRTIAAAAIVFSLCLLLEYQTYFFGITNETIIFVAKILQEAVGSVIFLVWAETLIPYGWKRSLIVVATAYLVMTLIQVSLSFVQRVPSMFLMSLLPVMSYFAFAYFKTTRKLNSFENPAEVLDDASFINISQDSDNTPKSGRYLQPTLIIIAFCFVLIVGNILHASLDIQQATFRLPVAQLGIAFGAFFAGVILLFSVNLLDDRDNSLEVFLITIVFALLAIAYMLTTFTSGLWIASYLLFSNSALKLTMALVWLIAFAARKGTSLLASFAMGLAALLVARLFSSTLMLVDQSFETTLFNPIAATMLVLSLLCCFYLVINTRVTGMEPQADTTREDVPAPFQNALACIRKDYGLTSQEAKILRFLAQGRNVKYLSETLVLTPNTIKTHMRNLYAKLGVHSQQELISLIDKRVKAEHGQPKS